MEYFSLLSEGLERVRHDRFFAPFIKELENKKKTYKKTPMPVLDYKTFSLFEKTGDRLGDTRIRNERSQRLCVWALSYLLYGDEDSLEELRNAVFQRCSEVSWVPPAHLNTVTAKDYRGHIDLFSAITAADLAEIRYLTGDALGKELCELIETNLHERIFAPFESRSYWWEELKSNWASVCAGGVAMAYMYCAPERFPRVEERLLNIIQNYIDGLGSDACCTEGIEYWDFGFRRFLYFADMYRSFTEGKRDLRHGKIQDEAALYLQNVYFYEAASLSFSDAKTSYRLNNPGFISYLKENYEGFLVPARICSLDELRDGFNDVLRSLLWTRPELLSQKETSVESFKYYPDAMWFIEKHPTYCFAAKAGHNCEEHNHNDVGSFIIATSEGQLLCDPGSQIYTKEYFDMGLRYSHICASSLGHSVPTVNGKAQLYGKEYAARNVSAKKGFFEMDMGGAYGEGISLVRSFRTEDGAVELCDRFDKALNVKERFVTTLKPLIRENGADLGGLVLLADRAPRISTETFRGEQNSVTTLYVIEFDTENGEFKLRMELR